MASLPNEFTYGTIKGRVVTAVKDTADDPDNLPDAVAATGTVSFTPSVSTLVSKVTDTVILLQKIEESLDASGFFSVDLVSTSNVNILPSTFFYTMDIATPSGQIPSKAVNVPAGSVTDIATLYR